MYTLLVIFTISLLTPTNLDGEIKVKGFETIEECEDFFENLKSQLPLGINVESGECLNNE